MNRIPKQEPVNAKAPAPASNDPEIHSTEKTPAAGRPPSREGRLSALEVMYAYYDA